MHKFYFAGNLKPVSGGSNPVNKCSKTHKKMKFCTCEKYFKQW